MFNTLFSRIKPGAKHIARKTTALAIPRALGLIRGNRAISMIEVMITMVILSVGVMGTYQVVTQGTELERMSERRTKAIAFAREGIELVENIRDTNWLKFSSNYEGCFDVLDYDYACTTSNSGAVGTALRITDGSYIPNQLANSVWSLNKITSPVPETATGSIRQTYRTQFPLYLDGNGRSTQSGAVLPAGPIPLCKNDLQRNCDTGFTRELRITRPVPAAGILSPIRVTSIVTWNDSKRKDPYVIQLEYEMTNWKYEFYKK